MVTVRQYLRLAAVLLAAVGLAVLTSVSCHPLGSAAGAPNPAAPVRAAAARSAAAPPAAARAASAPPRAEAAGSGLCAGHHTPTAVYESGTPCGCAPDAGSGGPPPQHRLCPAAFPAPATAAGPAGPPVARPLPRDQFPGLLRV